jgi:hypothetical protein
MRVVFPCAVESRDSKTVAQQLLRPDATHPSSGEAQAQAQAPEPESLLADEPARDCSSIGLFNGAPDRFAVPSQTFRGWAVIGAAAEHDDDGVGFATLGL